VDAHYAQNYEELYRSHWWFRVRERVLVEVIRHVGLPPDAAILDVGCGNGLFFDKLALFGPVRGIEIDRSLIPANSIYQDQIFHWPLGAAQYSSHRYELITALDVIEHIENDRQAIDDIWAMLSPGGMLVITVPAFMTLWDRHDDINRHYRRYTRASLRGLLARRGKVLKLCYLFHALVLPKFAIAMLNRVCKTKAVQHAIPQRWINRAMETACWMEYRIIGHLSPPFGTSLLAVVQKPK
jgi:2-polyprenyl-3-methyl-5-hydroxy-6-metoxy-1,4-benzoquinol methylase